MPEYNPSNSTISQPAPESGPFLAQVVSHLDATYMGILEVQILHDVGNSNSEGQLHQVKYMSPFFGRTDVRYNGKDNDYNNTQKSYGMWMVPPDVGSIVIVIFIEGNPKRGYWIGCVQDEAANFMIPGYAATENNVEQGLDTPYGHADRVPVAEYNKNYPGNNTTGDKTKIKKPMHPFAQLLADQGLLLDDVRGITTSSARRETPSMVFGISTPGPLDKNGQTGSYGKVEHQVSNAPVSRLGGSSFVMDDGDDKYLRRKSPSEGGPDYAAVEENELDGDVTRPNNELIRLRTRTGHQILLHTSEDLIYITNSRGTAWVELTSDGKIDIFSQDSINIRTAQDMNFYADRDINMECGRNFNTKVKGEQHTHVIKDHILIVDGNQKIHIKKDVDNTYVGEYKHKVAGNFDFNIKGHNFQTSGGNTEIKAANTTISGGNIHFNGPTATTAKLAVLPQRLKLHKLPDETGEFVESAIPPTIMRRVITTEPYPQHENLDATKYKPNLTDRDIDGRYEDTDADQIKDQADFSESMIKPAEYWKKYSTNPDTFTRNPPAEDSFQQNQEV